jgi:hypothetical protein
MSQATITMDANQSGTAYTSELSDALAAVDTCHSGASAPTDSVAAGKLWLDTSAGSPVLKIYNNGWKTLFTVGSSNVTTNLSSGTFATLSATTSGLGTMTGTSVAVSGAVSGGSLTAGSGTLTAGASTLGATGVTSLTSSGSVTGTGASFSGTVSVTAGEIQTNQIDNYSGTNITVQAPLVLGANSMSCTGVTSAGDVAITSGELQTNQIDNYSGTDITVQAPLALGSNALTCGSVTATGNITAFSDVRLKSNIETITDAVAKTEKLRGTSYVMNGEQSIGVIAQELEEVLPELVFTNDEGMKSVAYGNIVAVLIEAVKEQQETIRSFEERIAKLEK